MILMLPTCIILLSLVVIYFFLNMSFGKFPILTVYWCSAAPISVHHTKINSHTSDWLIFKCTLTSFMFVSISPVGVKVQLFWESCCHYKDNAMGKQ